MDSPTESLEFDVRPTPYAVRVRSWPLGEGGWRRWAIPLAAGAVCGLVAWRVGPVEAAAVGLAQAIVLWRWFLPVTFELSAAGLTQRAAGRIRRFPWSAFSRFRVFSDGVLLLSDRRPWGLESLRGLYVPFHGQQVNILSLIKQGVRQDESRRV